MNRKRRYAMIALIVLALAVLAAALFSKGRGEGGAATDRTIGSRDTLLKLIERHEIRSLDIRQQGEGYQVDARTARGAVVGCLVIGTDVDGIVDAALRQKGDMGISFRVDGMTATGSSFPWGVVAPLVGLILLLGGVAKHLSSDGSGIGQKGNVFVPERSLVTMAQAAGVDEAKAELLEVVHHLRNPRGLMELGGLPLRGVLLLGPPGTGKTLLARAVAGEANVPFFAVSGPEFLKMYMGEGARRVRELFAKARELAPAIIFIDELDTIGQERGGSEGGRVGDPATLNQLLIEMDGFKGGDGLVVIAATNRPAIIDPALRRPGRFDRTISVELSDVRGREAILRTVVQTRKAPLDPGVMLERLARATPGFSGADLTHLVNEAAMRAFRDKRTTLTVADFEAARDRVILGSKSQRTVSPEEQRIVAIHEAGHAVVASFLPHSDPVYKVTIVGRGDALGMVARLPTEDRLMMTRRKLVTNIAVMLGGRLAEERAFALDEVTTGAASDLKQATETAYRMVVSWGLSRKNPAFSHDRIYFDGRGDGSGPLNDEIRAEVDHIIAEARALAVGVLDARSREHGLLVAALLERETLALEDIQALFAPSEPASAPEGSVPAA